MFYQNRGALTLGSKDNNLCNSVVPVRGYPK